MERQQYNQILINLLAKTSYMAASMYYNNFHNYGFYTHLLDSLMLHDLQSWIESHFNLPVSCSVSWMTAKTILLYAILDSYCITSYFVGHAILYNRVNCMVHMNEMHFVPSWLSHEWFNIGQKHSLFLSIYVSFIDELWSWPWPCISGSLPH